MERTPYNYYKSEINTLFLLERCRPFAKFTLSGKRFDNLRLTIKIVL